MRKALLGAFALITILAVMSGCSEPTKTDRVARTNPLQDAKFFSATGGSASQEVMHLLDQGRRKDAELILNKIANQPTAVWLTAADQDLQPKVRVLVGQASAAKKLPVLVAYYLPHRDCGSFSAGGAPSASAYRRWIAEVATGIGNAPAVVILEPDALPHIVDKCLPVEQSEERIHLLHEAVVAFKKMPGTHVYIDAGNSNWKAPRDMAVQLRAAGVLEADGFSVNVANFRTTQESVRYGEELSRSLDGLHFVIDTSRNGLGPLLSDPDGLEWCNPPGRALGTPPTSATGHPLVDAYLWVKQPGESDGACRLGAPVAGRWWTEYAVELARNTP